MTMNIIYASDNFYVVEYPAQHGYELVDKRVQRGTFFQGDVADRFSQSLHAAVAEDASVEFRVLDASGHEVARWSRDGKRSDNLDTWDPSGVPAGLYVARVKFSGPGGSRTESVPLGILR